MAYHSTCAGTAMEVDGGASEAPPGPAVGSPPTFAAGAAERRPELPHTLAIEQGGMTMQDLVEAMKADAAHEFAHIAQQMLSTQIGEES